MATKTRDERPQAERAQPAKQADFPLKAGGRPGSSFLWERLPGESVQAFARFLAYRDTEPGERSYAKTADVCGISKQLVDRWGKRWSWCKRAVAYDSWLLELSDRLGKRAHLSHRNQAARFGSLALDKASRTLEKLDESTMNAQEVCELANTGTRIARQALQIEGQGQTVADRALNASVNVSFGSSWYGKPSQTPETLVLSSGEKVLGEIAQAPVNTGLANPPIPNNAHLLVNKLAERLVKCPVAKNKDI